MSAAYWSRRRIVAAVLLVLISLVSLTDCDGCDTPTSGPGDTTWW